MIFKLIVTVLTIPGLSRAQTSTTQQSTTLEITTTQPWLDDCLKRVNEIRANHQAPPYTMDPDLVKYAEWRCPNADAGHLQDDDAHGENIAQGWAPSPGIIVDVDFRSCSAVMDYWASEEVNYDYAGHGANNRGETMHFTALVWVNSTIIGCAKCPSHAYQISVVCNFQAPGNIEEPSYEAANVFPPLDSNIP